MPRFTGVRSLSARLAGAALIAALAAAGPVLAQATDTAWSESSIEAARGQLVDQLASEQIDRLDFRASTYEGAIALIRTTADTALDVARADFSDPQRAAVYLQTVTRALDDHEPRGLSLTFLDGFTIPVVGESSARLLGEVLGTAAAIVRDHLGGEAPEVSVAKAADALFRTPVLDPEEGLSYLQQYHDELMRIADLPEADRGRMLEE